MTTSNIKNRVETGVETLKQPIVEHPWYDPQKFPYEIVMILVTVGGLYQYLQLGDSDGIVIAVLGVTGLVTMSHSHYKSEMRWRDKT